MASLTDYIPPGIRFLAKTTAPTVLAVCAVAVALPLTLKVQPPIWLLVATGVLFYPISFAVNVQYKEFRKRRTARSLGAVLPKAVEHKLPAGIDIVMQMSDDLANRYPAYRLYEWPEKYGHTYNIRALFDDRILTCDPEYLKIILASEFSKYEKGPLLREQQRVFLGDGVFNADGEMWKFHRVMSRPFFSKDRIGHFEIFDRIAEDALGQVKARFKEGYPVDMQELLGRFMLDSATSFLFGSSIGSLSVDLSYPPVSEKAANAPVPTHPSYAFNDSFMELQKIIIVRTFYGEAWPLSEFWRDKVIDHVKIMDAFAVPVTEAALKKKAEAQASGDKSKGDETLLEHLVNSSDDLKVIRDETLNVLLAARDATAASMTFIVYMLSQHPDVLKRLRAEILETVGSGRPDYEDIKRMKYLRAVINETLRLYPSIPLNIKQLKQDAVLPPLQPDGQPIFIAAGTRVQFSVMVMHRRKDLWGPDAAEFDPDRFLDERLDKYLTPNPYIFLPFNAGPRVCIGQQFAYNAISFIIIRLLQQFSAIKLVQDKANPDAVPPPGWAECKGSNGKDIVRLRSYLTLFIDGGLWVEMDEAE